MRVEEILCEQVTEKLSVCCQAVQMGMDYTICVWGGDTPHVGSVVMSTIRPSLTGEGTGVTSSVLNGIGHKDEDIARLFAETIAKESECTVVCSCGIHIDKITKEQLQKVSEACHRLLKRLVF